VGGRVARRSGDKEVGHTPLTLMVSGEDSRKLDNNYRSSFLLDRLLSHSCISRMDQTCWVAAELSLISTRKLSYHKDDRAMRPIYGCPENFRESVSTPTATFGVTFNELPIRVPIDPVNVRTKFEVRSVTHS